MRLFLIALILLGSSQQRVTKDPLHDDAQVVSAVLAQTVRREVDKLLARPDGWRGSPLVVLLDRTVPMCPDKAGPWEECVDGAAVQRWSTAALSSAFTARNARSVLAPSVQVPNVLFARY